MSRNQKILAELNELRRTEPDAASTQHAIERTQLALNESFAARTTNSGRRAKRMLVRGLVAIAAAAVVVFCVAQWLPSASISNVAFAQVQSRIAKTKSVQFLESITSKVRQKVDDNVREQTIPDEQIRRVAILDGRLMRVEVTDKLGDYWAAKGKSVEPYVMIYDLKTPKFLSLWPEKKGYTVRGGVVQTLREYRVFDTVIIGGKLAPEWNAKEITPDSHYSLYDQICEVPIENAKRLPGQTINEKKTVGFLIEGKKEQDQWTTATWQHTYWVDPNTALPVKIEYSIRFSTARGDLTSSGQIRDIVFDAPLDPKLFSTDPPKGWTDLAAPTPDEVDGSKSK